jgi:hypothetical protein
MHDVTLAGLDGTNPLGFLAALGVLSATTDESSDVRLKWQYDGAWRPVLISIHADSGTLVDSLDADRKRCTADPALAFEYDGKRDLKPAPGQFRLFLMQLSGDATAKNRRSVDWASAFATDVAIDNNGNAKPTALHFTAGQQQFLQMVAELVRNVTKADLREALEGPWKYERPLPVLGWDATSSRDYALRATDPSTDKKLGVPGADWLAVRGLRFIQTVPRGGRVITTGCTGGWKDGRFRWPVWTVPLSASVVMSLLRQDVEGMTRSERSARGIGLVLSSGIKRSDQGGYGSFEPASII